MSAALPAGAPLLEADALATAYPGARVPALASVTFAAPAGGSIAVLGPTAAGSRRSSACSAASWRRPMGRCTCPRKVWRSCRRPTARVSTSPSAPSTSS